MKLMHESIFKSSLRAFFVAFFAVIGILVGLIIIIAATYGAVYFTEEDNLSTYAKLLPDANGKRKELSNDVPVILQIAIKGEIGSDSLTGSKIENILLKSRENLLKSGRVKGILLAIDSPGGDATDSDIIYRLLKDYKNKYNIPILAYVDGVCASGGYYIACAADRILTSEASIIGSIGVLSWPPFVNISHMIEKIGAESLTVYAGKGKDALNPLRPWHEGEQDNYQKLVDFFYDRFVSIVSTNRPQIQTHDLVNSYGARVFASPEAKQIGLIDATGYSRNEALKELVQSAGILETQKYQVICFETQEWWKKIFNQNSPLLTGKIRCEFDLPAKHSRGHVSYLYSP